MIINTSLTKSDWKNESGVPMRGFPMCVKPPKRPFACKNGHTNSKMDHSGEFSDEVLGAGREAALGRAAAKKPAAKARH